MEYEEFIDVIRQASGGLDGGGAQRAAHGTLQTLAERLPRSEAQHLFLELPDELKPWVRLEMDETLPVGDRFRRAHGVLDTLAEAVNEKEWLDVAVELPREYRRLMPVRTA